MWKERLADPTARGFAASLDGHTVGMVVVRRDPDFDPEGQLLGLHVLPDVSGTGDRECASRQGSGHSEGSAVWQRWLVDDRSKQAGTANVRETRSGDSSWNRTESRWGPRGSLHKITLNESGRSPTPVVGTGGLDSAAHESRFKRIEVRTL